MLAAQTIAMDQFIANGVQVANAPEATAGANIVSNMVSMYATRAGTADVLVLAVLQADDTISGSATIGGGSVTIGLGNQTYPINNGKFSIPVSQ